MTLLGDFFGDSKKEEFAQQSVRIGSVVKLWMTDTTPPKEKRIVVVGTTVAGDYLGVVLINSEINWNVQRNPAMYDWQLFMQADECTFLDHDSYADCTQLREIPKSYIVGEVLNDMQRALGKVPDDLFNEIRTRVRNAPTISPKMRKRFGLI